jgi:hypothetical protein
MKEYIVKLTKTEVEALTYSLGRQNMSTPILTSNMYYTLLELVFDGDKELYFDKNLKHSDTLHFKGL